MFKKIVTVVVFATFLYFILLSLQPVRYYIWYPTIQSAYPNNGREIRTMMRDYFPKRTQENIQFFKLTENI